MSFHPDPRSRLDEWLDARTVAGLVPECYAAFRPLIADALQFFVSRLSQKRWNEIAANQATLPAEIGAAARLVQLMHACPTLHKLGQVLARHRALDRDFRAQLQRLESFEPMTPMHDVRTILDQELSGAVGPCTIEFEPQSLAEASVAVVTAGTWSPDAGLTRSRAAFKVMKPGVQERLTEELGILADLSDYLDERRSTYHLPKFEYRDTFETVRDVLECEIRFEFEQRNLDLAARRYAHRDDVAIPGVLPFCTPRVTAMDRIDGAKVTHCDEWSSSRRRALARTLVDALLADVIFAREAESVFHADPHAGNLFAMPDGRLAILDWSLTGRMTKAQREQTAQIILAAMRLDAVEIGLAIDALSSSKSDESSVRIAVSRAIDEVVQGHLPGPTWLIRLLDRLATVGVRFPADLMLLRKAMLTVEGVVADVDECCRIDAVMMTRFMLEFGAEWPSRAFTFPASRQFGTHVSNADLARIAAALPVAAMQSWFRSWAAWAGTL